MQFATDQKRLVSLDFMRGLIMILLMLEGSFLYERLYQISSATAFNILILQFFHHPWHGLRFWDLIQPGFMFIAGAAMAYSLLSQQQKGMPHQKSFMKVLKRSAWLFFWGVTIYAVKPNGLYFELWNVLTQMSFTTLIAFLIFEWKISYQLIFSFLLLVFTELLYRFTHIDGFDMPFVDQHNFGNYMDLVLMNKTDVDGWVAMNCLPTACHTIWGALAGRLLFSLRPEKEKVVTLILFGTLLIIIGYSLNVTITPIIKRIATSSFVLVSGGWCMLALAFFYWWIDIKNHKRFLLPFMIIGMNSLFIYLVFEIVGAQWFNNYVDKVAFGLLSLIAIPASVIAITSSIIIFILEFLLCRFLYKREIFIKI